MLDEEFRVLHPADAARTSLPGWLLAENQMTGLEHRLRDGSAVSRHFRSALSETTRRALDGGPVPTGTSVTAMLVAELNALLQKNQLLYGEELLPDDRLDRSVSALRRLRVSGDALTRVNRLLLECAFPGSIARIEDIRLRAIHRRVHEARRGNACAPAGIALCLSGGGIRSATFGLGVLQGLARAELLDKLDYLSTVSGGGYVGAWLTSWTHRHRDGARGVMTQLANERPASPLAPEPRPVQHLREYSNYLSPRLGWLSADTWALVGTYLRNLLLNWTVLLPLLLGALALPRVIVALTLADPAPPWRWLVLAIGLAGMLVGVTYIGLFRPSLEEHRGRLPAWLQRRGDQPGFLAWCLAPLLVAAVALTTYWAWGTRAPSTPPARTMLLLVVVGTGMLVLSWVAHSTALRRLSLGELAVTAATGAVGGALVAAAVEHVLPHAPAWSYVEYYVSFAVPIFLIAFLLAATVFVGLMSRETTDEDREWWARSGAWTLVAVAAWAVFCALVLLGPPALLYSWTVLVSTTSFGTLAGAVAVMLGRSGSTSSAATSAVSLLKDRAASLAAPVALLVLAALLSLATSVMLPIPAVCRDWPVLEPPLPVLPEQVRHAESLRCTGPWQAVLWMLGCLGVAFGASSLINVNKFSLHAMYRTRLIRAYLGASREQRRPNPFTGFDPLDNVQMHELRDEAFTTGSFRDLRAFVRRLQQRSSADRASEVLFSCLSPATRQMIDRHVADAPPSGTLEQGLLDDLNLVLDTVALAERAPFQALATGIPAGRVARSDSNRALLEAAYPEEIARRPPPPRKPLHVLNLALNLVGGHNLAWQERKAETFTVTELHSGSYRVGYRRSSEYGGTSPRGISLGTAVAISGAAASPNMGYHSSPVVAFLMTLVNARLGWWLGNPGPHGRATFRESTPRVSIWPMLREAAGLTDDEYRYVYLSDGGHFDNLGLLEMVLRRCHLILVSDAGCDPTCAFEDLGNAIRKVRIDLGVPITVDTELRIHARAAAGAAVPQDAAYFAQATVHYSSVDEGGVDGKLIYVKPSFYGREPVDVLNYALAHAAFPHESTGDQFFSESQFESYRALGLYAITEVLRMLQDEPARVAPAAKPGGPPPE